VNTMLDALTETEDEQENHTISKQPFSKKNQNRATHKQDSSQTNLLARQDECRSEDSPIACLPSLEDFDSNDRTQLTVSSISTIHDFELNDCVQLTVSSVNTVLDSLTEIEDVQENHTISKQPLSRTEFLHKMQQNTATQKYDSSQTDILVRQDECGSEGSLIACLPSLEDFDSNDRSQLTISSFNGFDFHDRSQLTVTSINTIFEAPAETEDKHEADPEYSQALLSQQHNHERNQRTTVHVVRSKRLLIIESVEMPLTDPIKNGSSSSHHISQQILAKKSLNKGIVSVIPGSAKSRHSSGESSMKKPSALKQKVNQSIDINGSHTEVVEKPPCVSFGADTMFIETTVSNQRPRASSDAASRFRTNSVVDWHKNKLAWLKEKRDQRRREGLLGEKPGKVKDGGGLGPSSPKLKGFSSAENEDLNSTRMRGAKPDKFGRPKKELSVEVTKIISFEWPLGRLGKLRHKAAGGKQDNNIPMQKLSVRSASIGALTKHEAARFQSGHHPDKHNKVRVKPKPILDKAHSISTSSKWWGKIFFEKSKVKGRKLPRSSADCQSGKYFIHTQVKRVES